MALFKKFQIKPIEKVAKVEKVTSEGEEVSQVSQLSQADPSLLIQWKTKTGRTLYLITSERIRQKAPPGKAVFSMDELNQMRGLPDEQIEAIINVKETFPESIIEPDKLEQENNAK